MDSNTILLDVHPEFTDLNTVDCAAKLASKTHAAVKVMHVVEDYPEDMSEWWNVRNPLKLHEQIVRDRQEFLDSMVARVKEAGVERVEAVLGWGREFLEVTREVLRNHEKLVVTTFRRKGLRAKMGCSCIAGLCRYTPCPVWMTRSRPNKPCKRIMVVLDGHGGEIKYEGLNTKILKTAAAMAEHQGSELHIVHVLPPHDEKRLHAEVAEYLRDLHHGIKAGVNDLLRGAGLSLTDDQIHLFAGSAAAVVPEFAQEKGVDLIVMGTRACDGLSGLLVGNTAERVMAQVDCEMLVVKPDDFVSLVAQEERATSRQRVAA